MAIGQLRMILFEMHSELEISKGALTLSEEGNMESALFFIRGVMCLLPIWRQFNLRSCLFPCQMVRDFDLGS
jgi:hypothetical protein